MYIPATPGDSRSTRWGWNMHSGASNRSEPTLIVRPSGSYEVINQLQERAQLMRITV